MKSYEDLNNSDNFLKFGQYLMSNIWLQTGPGSLAGHPGRQEPREPPGAE